MNGFQHVADPNVLGGHWWTFEAAKHRRIVTACGDDYHQAKRVCYALGNRHWPAELNAYVRVFAARQSRRTTTCD